MVWGKMRVFLHLAKLTAPFTLLSAVALLTVSCAPVAAPKPSSFRSPSKVITEVGVEFYVYKLKLPGTYQDFKLKQAGADTWVPLSVVRFVYFTGPETDGYRPAKIVLTSGESLQGDVLVDHLIEGTTDVGYWNMPLREVRQMSLGEE